MGMTFSEYVAAPGINWSTLKAMDASPLHYRHRVDNPPADSTRLLMGRAVHTAVLEPDMFPLQYVVFDGPARRGRAWDEFAEANATRGILKADEYATCLAVRDAVHAHKPAAVLLKRGEAERSIFWDEPSSPVTGCKARLDYVSRGVIVDLKTTGTVDAREFGRTAGRMLYHGQASFYRRGMDAIAGAGHAVAFIAVEIEPPHDVAVFSVDVDAAEAGDQLVDRLLDQVARCYQDDSWPGRYAEAMPLELPGWLLPQSDEVWGGLTA